MRVRVRQGEEMDRGRQGEGKGQRQGEGKDQKPSVWTRARSEAGGDAGIGHAGKNT